jgi:tRNA1Val (adenine37-N6)-methyltransferase
MVLVEAVRGGRHDLTVEAPLVVYRENGTYTEEVLRIYGRDTLSGRDSYRES